MAPASHAHGPRRGRSPGRSGRGAESSPQPWGSPAPRGSHLVPPSPPPSGSAPAPGAAVVGRLCAPPPDAPRAADGGGHTALLGWELLAAVGCCVGEHIEILGPDGARVFARAWASRKLPPAGVSLDRRSRAALGGGGSLPLRAELRLRAVGEAEALLAASLTLRCLDPPAADAGASPLAAAASGWLCGAVVAVGGRLAVPLDGGSAWVEVAAAELPGGEAPPPGGLLRVGEATRLRLQPSGGGGDDGGAGRAAPAAAGAATAAGLDASGGGAAGGSSGARRRHARGVPAGAPTPRLDALGGLPAGVRAACLELRLSLWSPGLFRTLRVQPSRGVLLCGAPGCGRSAAARALAADAAGGEAAVVAASGAQLLAQAAAAGGDGVDALAVALSRLFAVAAGAAAAVGGRVDGCYAAGAGDERGGDGAERGDGGDARGERDGDGDDGDGDYGDGDHGDVTASVLVLDDLELVAPARAAAAGGGGGGARAVGRLLVLLDGLGDGGDGGDDDGDGDARRGAGRAGDGGRPRRGGRRPGLAVVATSARPDWLDPALRRPGRLDVELRLPPPSAAGRLSILNAMAARARAQADARARAGAGGGGGGRGDVALAAPALVPLSAAAARRLAAAAHGYVAADLALLLREFGDALVTSPPSCVTASPPPPEPHGDGVTAAEARALAVAFARVPASALRDSQLELPTVRWADIGGRAESVGVVREAVEWPLKHASAFARLGVRPPRGVLLYGPPGCAKTLTAKALATESGLSFLAVKGPELFSKWVGESEQAVATLFARARAAAPAIVFFDEIDALAPSRGAAGGGGGSGVGARVLAQLLHEMDGIGGGQDDGGDGGGGGGGGGGDGSSGDGDERARGSAAAACSPLVVVLAATNRPDLIDGALLRPGRFDRLLYVGALDCAGRLQVLRVHTRATPLAADVSLEAVAAATGGYSGAELAALCREAALAALVEARGAEAVRGRHFAQAALVVTPRTPPALLEVYERYQRRTGALLGGPSPRGPRAAAGEDAGAAGTGSPFQFAPPDGAAGVAAALARLAVAD